MITAPVSQHHNVTPDDLSQEKDMLLLAGSNVSMREIYKQEIELPILKGKYYKTQDVDNLFVMLNGIFASVSEKAYSNNKALVTARENAAAAIAEKESVSTELDNVKSQMDALANENAQLKQLVASLQNQQPQQEQSPEVFDLQKQLDELQNEYTRLLESSASDMSDKQSVINEQHARIEHLLSELDDNKLQIASMENELETLLNEQSAMVPDTGLQSAYNVLQYKYDNLKDMSERRIQSLTKEMTKIKELGNVK